MEILFVGTGSGKTSLKRNHSAFVISSVKTKLLVDAGDGISKALLQSGVKFNSINSIIITHHHPDHLSGLPSLLNQMKMKKRSEVLTLFCPGDPVLLKSYIETNFIFISRLGFKLDFVELYDNCEIILEESLSFIVKKNSHLNKYSEEEKRIGKEFISLSVLFNIEGKNVYYSGDIGSASDLYLYKENFDVMITETTHLTAEELKTVVVDLNPQKLILIHIEDEAEERLSEFIQLNKELASKTILAYDSYKFQI